MKHPKGRFFVCPAQVVAIAATSDRNDSGESLGKLFCHGPGTETAAAEPHDINARAIYAIFRHDLVECRLHLLDWIKQFFTRILRREHQERE
ncbi:hypothetical protein D3C87_1947050 [compost metagenome]